MIIKPYSALDTSAELAQNTSNFPAVKHFFQCTEQSGLTLTDSVGGVVVTASSMTFPDTYSVNPVRADAAVTSGTWASLTADSLLFVVGNPGVAGAIAFGNPTSGQGDMIAINAFTTPSVRKTATTVNATAITANAQHAHGMLIDFGGNVTSFDTNGGTYNAKAPVALTGVANASAMQARMTANGYTSIYGMLIMSFSSGLPDDIKAGVLWMYAQWIAGNKVIYPGWKDKT
jgi:hypothetical protein